MNSEDVEKLLEQLESVTASPPDDPKLQQRLYDAALKLKLAVEAPLDTVYRVIYSPMLLSSAQTATYMRIFNTLSDRGRPCTVAELAEPRGADVVFTARILRFLASHGLVSEVAEDIFEANRLTKTLSVNAHRAGMNQTQVRVTRSPVETTARVSLAGVTNGCRRFHILAPAIIKAPDFFRQTRFQNPNDVVKTPFQLVNSTDLPAIEWTHDNRPDIIADFGIWMTALRGQNTWMDVIDFEALIKAGGADDAVIDAETPVFVDVGGGIGSQCANFKTKMPNLPGRVVLEDLPVVLQHALDTEGVEIVAHNFWTEQPVKEARAYYFRTILHDYPDEKCLAILEHTIAAMGPKSFILIDDIIIPDKGAHPRTTEMDYIMMTTLAAMERTRKQWDDLFSAAGLEVVQRATYLQDTADSIQVVVPKGRKEA